MELPSLEVCRARLHHGIKGPVLHRGGGLDNFPAAACDHQQQYKIMLGCFFFFPIIHVAF